MSVANETIKIHSALNYIRIHVSQTSEALGTAVEKHGNLPTLALSRQNECKVQTEHFLGSMLSIGPVHLVIFVPIDTLCLVNATTHAEEDIISTSMHTIKSLKDTVDHHTMPSSLKR